MKELWLDLLEGGWEQRRSLLAAGLEAGASAFLLPPSDVEKARKLAKLRVVSRAEGADLYLCETEEEARSKPGPKVLKVCIESGEDLKRAIEASRHANYLVVEAKDWKVIPLENLIAMAKAKLIFEARSEEEAKLALETLEKGCDGILYKPTSPSEVKSLAKVVSKPDLKLKLEWVEVSRLEQVGLGDRVCVDTCSMLRVGEGLLVGSQAEALFLVHSETVESEYVTTRPFRVNAGAVHAYVLLPDMTTKYLSELRAGDKVLVVDWRGNTREEVVGRVKIERRPLLLIEARREGRSFRTLVQNAETIRLVAADNGKPVSVAELRPGDKLLAYLPYLVGERRGRHFGVEVEETVVER